MDTQVASRKRRIMALLIDVWFFGYLTSVFMYLVFFIFKTPWDTPVIHNSLSLSFVIWATSSLIFAAKDSYKGMGLGKLVMGIRVCRSDGAQASPVSGIIRNIPLLIWPIEALVMVVSSSKRRIGDYAADTQVRRDKRINSSSRWLGLLFILGIYWAAPSLPDIEFSEQGLMDISQLIVKQSHVYELAEEKIRQEHAVVDLIGVIKSINVRNASNVVINNDGGEAEFVLDVTGEHGVLPVMVRFKRSESEWQLIQMRFEQIKDMPVN